MPIVGMPDGTQVQFPDEMPSEQIRGLIAQKFPDAANLKQPASFAERFQEPEVEPPGLRPALQERATAITQGPAQPAMAQMAQGFGNVIPAASQGTSPNIDAYKGQLISPRTTVDELGNVLYIDPATGGLKETDSATQVALRDPVDGQLKIYSRSPETDEGAAVGVARVLSPGLGAGAPTARPAIAAATKAVQPRASDVFATAKAPYREFKQVASQIDVPAETASGMAERIRRALDKANFIPELAQPVYSAVGILDRGEPLTLDVLQNIKRTVGRAFKSPDANVRDAAGVASKEIVKIINEFSPQAGKAYKTADAIQSTAYSLRDLQQKEAVAKLQTGRAGYGGNAVNALRQRISPIVQKSIEERTTGFKPNEIGAMEQFVTGSRGANAARMVGGLSPAKGGIQQYGALGAMYAAGPAGAALPVLGAVGNKLATILDRADFDKIKALVAKRSPAYAEAVRKAVERYERSQVEFASDPSPAKRAAFAQAAQSLSNGLSRDGVTISARQLMQGLQGPMRGSAEDEQPEPVGILNQ